MYLSKIPKVSMLGIFCEDMCTAGSYRPSVSNVKTGDSLDVFRYLEATAGTGFYFAFPYLTLLIHYSTTQHLYSTSCPSYSSSCNVALRSGDKI